MRSQKHSISSVDRKVFVEIKDPYPRYADVRCHRFRDGITTGTVISTGA